MQPWLCWFTAALHCPKVTRWLRTRHHDPPFCVMGTKFSQPCWRNIWWQRTIWGKILHAPYWVEWTTGCRHVRFLSGPVCFRVPTLQKIRRVRLSTLHASSTAATRGKVQLFVSTCSTCSWNCVEHSLWHRGNTNAIRRRNSLKKTTDLPDWLCGAIRMTTLT